MSEQVNFVDILEPAFQSGICSVMFRNWYPQRSFLIDKYYTPKDLKDAAANSMYLDCIIESESSRTGESKERLRQEILNYLEEIGLDKKLHVIRWIGVFFLNVCSMMKVKLFVNEPAILQLKSTMGKNPVLFLPTHRSYADFCLMTYLCYHYDIDFPAVAAGMDFYSMAVIGRLMREACAFYIRRSLAGAPLYAATLKQYVRTLVSRHCAPIEFFLEGTRSRSNMSLPPKYGMLSMMLLPLFAREVSDVTIVPVNISYDRLMEHALFAYEHLGVPKPKESTGGLIKALRSLNDHFGNIYINLGSPISVREYLKNSDEIISSDETLKPVHIQELTPEQFRAVQNIADYVITLQQKSTVATISNLLALVLMHSLMRSSPLTFEELIDEVGWMIGVLRSLGASVFENDVRGSVERILVVHGKMVRLDKERKLRLISTSPMELSYEVEKKMKGHKLKAETMVEAIPIIQLQMYVNPVLHYLVPPAIVSLIVHRAAIDRDKLLLDYCLIRRILKHEFFYIDAEEENTFNKAVDYCIQNAVIKDNNGLLSAGDELKLRHLLQWSAWPALTTVSKCAEVMIERVECSHKQALKLVQQRVESHRCHPYCLSLSAGAAALGGLATLGALHKYKQDEDVIYKLVPSQMNKCHSLVNSVLPYIQMEFNSSNPVVLDQKTLSKL